MGMFFGGIVFIYVFMATLIFTTNTFFVGLPVQPVNWVCTLSKITRQELPKQETCVQWTKTDSKVQEDK